MDAARIRRLAGNSEVAFGAPVGKVRLAVKPLNRIA
jgi:hypothetical protein